MEEVKGSIPLRSTKQNASLAEWGDLLGKKDARELKTEN